LAIHPAIDDWGIAPFGLGHWGGPNDQIEWSDEPIANHPINRQSSIINRQWNSDRSLIS
jgi:hypothetical protein